MKPPNFTAGLYVRTFVWKFLQFFGRKFTANDASPLGSLILSGILYITSTCSHLDLDENICLLVLFLKNR